VKLAVVVAFTLILFTVSSWAGMAVAAVAVGIAIAVSRVPWRLVARGLAPVAWLLGFTLVANGLAWQDPEAVVALGPLSVDLAGLAVGAFFSARIVLLMLGTTLLTLTSSPVALTDGLASVMRPLALVRFPVDDVAMMFSIALRFIPTTAEEAERIIVAQTARGAVFDRGGPVARVRAWTPVLIPLVVRLFRRADDLAVAMESRCYSGAGRTRLRELVMRPADWVVLAATVGVCALAVVIG
jgi:energy-coupling factor transport system permease protein